MQEIKNKILEEYKNGNIVCATFEGLEVYNLKEFLKQPSTGILYDLNRRESVILSFIEDPKWVNDYACAKVIHALKEENEFLKQELKRFQ